MIRGTTPTFTFTLKDDSIDLSEALDLIVTIKQSGKRIDIPASDLEIDGGTVSLYLTQEQSLKLTEGVDAWVQINWIYTNPRSGSPRRAATKPKSFCVGPQYYERVME